MAGLHRAVRQRHVWLLAPFVALVAPLSRPISDNSFLWHVRAGTVQLDLGEVLRADPFSYTSGGEPWRTQSWLAELGYGWLERTFDGVGWSVLLDTPMSGHNQFGNLRVGTLCDCLALPGHVFDVAAAATLHLESAGVDVIVSNQAHVDWRRALGRCVFLSGPSNFLFAASPALAKLLEPFDRERERIHMTRGDGDGPIHL